MTTRSTSRYDSCRPAITMITARFNSTNRGRREKDKRKGSQSGDNGEETTSSFIIKLKSGLEDRPRSRQGQEQKEDERRETEVRVNNNNKGERTTTRLET